MGDPIRETLLEIYFCSPSSDGYPVGLEGSVTVNLLATHMIHELYTSKGAEKENHVHTDLLGGVIMASTDDQ